MSLSPQDTLPRELPRPAPGGFFTDRSPPQGETQMVDPTQMFQNFWRCAHHPSALENFEARRTTCEFECHCQPLRWYHNGVHPMPKSWGGR
jgi:hypothetical protein